MMAKKKVLRNSIIHALILQGNVRKLSSKFISPKKGKGAKYNRHKNKIIEEY